MCVFVLTHLLLKVKNDLVVIKMCSDLASLYNVECSRCSPARSSAACCPYLKNTGGASSSAKSPPRPKLVRSARMKETEFSFKNPQSLFESSEKNLLAVAATENTSRLSVSMDGMVSSHWGGWTFFKKEPLKSVDLVLIFFLFSGRFFQPLTSPELNSYGQTASRASVRSRVRNAANV